MAIAVSAAEIAEIRRLAGELGDSGVDFSAIQTNAELLGYVAAIARSEGIDESDGVELIVRAADMTREEIREAERVLRKLGYVAVSDRLKALARRARSV